MLILAAGGMIPYLSSVGGGAKGLLNNVKKTALFSRDGFPYFIYKADIVDVVAVLLSLLLLMFS